jgi:hypothetical protein
MQHIIDQYPHGTLLRLSGDIRWTDRTGNDWSCTDATVRVNRRGVKALFIADGSVSPFYRVWSVRSFSGEVVLLPATTA